MRARVGGPQGLQAGHGVDATLVPARGEGGRGNRGDVVGVDHLIMEGTYASAQALSAAGPARRARPLAESLLDVS